MQNQSAENFRIQNKGKCISRCLSSNKNNKMSKFEATILNVELHGVISSDIRNTKGCLHILRLRKT
jgi:hypothetical protein